MAHSFCTAVKRLSESKKHCQDCLMSSAQSFYGQCLQSVVHSLVVFPGMCHSSTRPCTSLHMTQFYQAFPHVSTASDKHWGEKAWVRGYKNTTIQCTMCVLFSTYQKGYALYMPTIHMLALDCSRVYVCWYTKCRTLFSVGCAKQYLTRCETNSRELYQVRVRTCTQLSQG